MPKPVKNNPVAAGKRKEVDAAANSQSGPPKKRHRKECSAEGCTNIAVSGGVCVSHGAKVKRCSAEGCTNQVQKGGVCIRHGAKVEYKRCSVEGCATQARTGGVCIRHGAKVERKRCSRDGCSNFARREGVCIRHGAKVKRCSVDGCPNQFIRRGVCKRHGANSANLLCQVIQGGGNKKNRVSTTVAEVSDNEEEGTKGITKGTKKQPPIVARKRKAKVQVRPLPTRRSDRLSKLGRKPKYNEDAAYPESGGNVGGDDEGGEEEVVNPEQDTTSELRPAKRARGVGDGNLKDDGEEEASPDVAPTQEGKVGPAEAMEDSDNWGDDGPNECDFGDEDNGDVISEEGKHSHVVPEEIATTANDVEKEREVQRLNSELNDSKNEVVELKARLNEQLKGASEELEAVKSQSKSEYTQLQSQMKHAEAQFREELEGYQEELVVKRAEKADLHSQLMNAATARLKEKTAKDALNKKLAETAKTFEAANSLWEDQKKKFTDELRGAEAQLEAKSDTVAKLNAEVALQRSKEKELREDLEKERSLFWNVKQEMKRLFATLCGTKTELKAKSDAEAEMKRKIGELKEQNVSLRNQLEKQSEGDSAVKEEELTDDEDIVTRWKERGTGKVPVNKKIMNATVDFAASEVLKREVELERAREKIDELRAENEELRRQTRFKVKNSSRVRRQTREKWRLLNLGAS